MKLRWFRRAAPLPVLVPPSIKASPVGFYAVCPQCGCDENLASPARAVDLANWAALFVRRHSGCGMRIKGDE